MTEVSSNIRIKEYQYKAINNCLNLFTGYHLNLNEKGFEISYTSYLNVSTVDVAVQVLVTTQQQNIKKLDMDLHCKSTWVFFFDDSFFTAEFKN